LDPFAKRLEALPCCIGQLLITRSSEVAFEVRHRDDAVRCDLSVYVEPDAAVEIARFDDGEKYRPLKTAPNLRHGWRLLLADCAAVRVAVDFFYPGRVAAFLAQENGALPTTPLRETLERQTGMYRIAARITDEQADELVAGFCRSDGGCLRTIRWKQNAAGSPASRLLPGAKFDPNHDQTGRGEVAIPLLCQEACSLLVAEARKVVKDSITRTSRA
jgi:sirohydrochlorin cobaltochelatase